MGNLVTSVLWTLGKFATIPEYLQVEVQLHLAVSSRFATFLKSFWVLTFGQGYIAIEWSRQRKETKKKVRALKQKKSKSKKYEKGIFPALLLPSPYPQEVGLSPPLP